MGAAGIAAVSTLDEERRTLEAFRDAGATDSERALPADELGLPGTAALRRLVRDGVVRETAPGVYYLDEAALARSRRRRPGGVLGLATALLVAGVAVWMGRRSGR